MWNPDADAFTTSDYNVPLAYPGDAYVDDIGLDAYDQRWVTPQTPANAWNDTTLPELTAARRFSALHGKPIAMTEWGVAIRTDGHGLGDDPLYVNNFTAWKNPNDDVTYESHFNDNTTGSGSTDLTGGSFPHSLAAFTADLG